MADPEKITELDANTTPAVADLLAMVDDVAGVPATEKITIADFFKVINALTAETAPAVNDEVALYDVTGSATDKMTLANLFKVINALTAEATAAVDDVLLLYDTDGATADKITIANFFKVITLLTAEVAPAVADEIVVYDADGATADKMTLANLFKVINALTAETAPAANDEVALYDVTGSAADKMTLANLFKVINALTAEAAPATDDELALYDITGSATDKITLANLMKVVDALAELAVEPAAADTLLVLDSGTPKKIQFSNLGIGGGGQARKSLPVSGCYLPDDSANNAAAQLQHKTSSGGALHPAWIEALFDDSTDEHIMFAFLMPDNYASAPVVDVYYKCTSAVANDVCFGSLIMAVTDGDAQDVDADSFAAANTQTDTVPGTAGHMGVCSITMSNADGVAANDFVVLVVYRDESGDGVAGDVEVPLVVLRYTST